MLMIIKKLIKKEINMIHFVVDSTFSVTKKYAQKHNITVVSLNTLLDGVTAPEGYPDTFGEFFAKLKQSKGFPKTSQPSPELFEQIFREKLKNDDDRVLVLTISVSLSGTYNAARIAKDNVDPNRISLVDSTQTGQSSLLLLESVVERYENEPAISLEELTEYAKGLTPKVCLQFVPQTMEYSRRGGRIGLLSATFASFLNIKPILVFKEGVLTCGKKTLGMANAMVEMIKSIPATVKKIYVAYVDHSNLLETFKEKVKAKFPTVPMDVGEISPVVGSHVGPGALGVAYIDA